MAKAILKDTTIADFGGGWNVADSDLNLNSRFQPVSENVIRGVNGSAAVRWGHQLFSDLRDGDEVVVTQGTIAYEVVEDSPYVILTKVAHGYSNGDHITITAATISTGVLGSIPATDLLGTFGIVVVDADHFMFAVRTAAAANETGDLSIPTFTIDDHTLAGNILHMQYFNRRLVVFDDNGEIATVSDDDGTAVRIWDAFTADDDTSGNPPTRECQHWSSTTFKSTVIACNGYDKDKPVQIDESFAVTFLVDKGTLSNAFVPRADIVLGLQNYVLFLRTDNGDTSTSGDPFVNISAKNTDGTFSGELAPQDAADVDLSMITDTVNPIVIGAAPFRDKVFVAFYDKGMIGTLGIYNEDGTEHRPDFSDTISEHGTIAHRTLVPLGNDIFMADYAGVPSVSISVQSGSFVPVRVSELIGPELQRHLASLSEETLLANAFALFNKSDRQYMLFLPKYDEVQRDAATDPFLFNDSLKELDQALLIVPNHKLFDQSFITIAGAVDIGTLDALDINGVREVVAVIDKDTIVVQLGGHPSASQTTFGGGAAVVYTPVNDETICYAFEYNKELKIKRWTRLRGLNFACGASTQRGRIYFAREGRIFRYGSTEEPIYADEISNYDYRTWANAFAYTAGDRVYDSTDQRTYVARQDHTSAAMGTFSDERDDNIDLWEEYQGEPIIWSMETPWSDVSERALNKIIQYVAHDTEGKGQFTFSLFTNQVYRDAQSYALAPKRAVQFSAGGVGGYGMIDPQGWGTGRRTREERVWPMPVKGKLIKMRYEGATRDHVRIISTTLYYKIGSIR